MSERHRCYDNKPDRAAAKPFCLFMVNFIALNTKHSGSEVQKREREKNNTEHKQNIPVHPKYSNINSHYFNMC